MNLVRFQKPANYHSFNNVFDEMMENFVSPARNSYSNCSTPATNVSEDDKKYTIEFSVPGYEKDNFRIKTEKGVLTISGEVKKDEAEKHVEYNRIEFSVSNFERSFTIPESVDDSNIKATYTNGILTVELPKKEVEIQKAIEIAVE